MMGPRDLGKINGTTVESLDLGGFCFTMNNYFKSCTINIVLNDESRKHYTNFSVQAGY